MYALYSTTDGTNDAGHFTARATLEADFTDGSITGTIDNFMVGALGNPTNEARDWSVELKKLGLLTDDNRIGQPASSTLGVQVDDTTVWTIDGSPADVSGNWHGGFMRTDNRDPSSGVPDGVAGRFYTEYGNNGKMTGGFGASCTTCPKEN